MSTQTAAPAADDAIRVYWQTGCTACLRTKEFLTRNRIPFISRDVLRDPGAFDELTRFGLRQVPIVTRGDQWANGQVLADVARVAGIPLAPQKLFPPEELARRIRAILAGAQRFGAQIPDAHMADLLPNRPRSYLGLVYHICNIVDCFLEHDRGIGLTYEAYDRKPPPQMRTKAELLAYARDVETRFIAWMDGPGRSAHWSARADVYYGEQTLHEFLERTTWHSGQHSRQLMWLLERQLGVKPDRPIEPEVFAGLPMPQQVWDGEGE